MIALPPTWANYGNIISTFSKKYGIKVNSANPDGTSQQEVNAIKQENGTAAAPDVVDVGQAVALVNTSLFTPYKVATWSSIPAAQKDASGLWYEDYGGYMAIGYQSKFGTITSLNDLLSPKFKGAVALNGDPTSANAGLNGVMLANLLSGGTPSDISKGVAWFHKLKQAGNFNPVSATGATIKAGTTPVVFNWDYLNLSSYVGVSNWKVFVPPGVPLGGYYTQAINKNAPHPAAARLWEEFLYSQAASAGQNLWLIGGARPVEQLAMANNGSLNQSAAAKLPAVSGTPVFLSQQPDDQRRHLPVGELAERHRLARERGCRYDDRDRCPARQARAPAFASCLGRHRAVPRLRRGLPAAADRDRRVHAFQNQNGGFSLSGLKVLGDSTIRGFFWGSIELCLISSVTGAVFGAILAYAVASGNPDGVVRRLYLAVSGVLAQFGGVTLAFAFLVPIGPVGLLTHASWYLDFPWGIAVIYPYFQIPLMVLVFMPAIDGLKVQWREASENLGASAWQYWRHVGGPLLAPAFLGSTLLLFANALSAFATIEAWENQIAYIVPQQISIVLNSEVGLANVNEADVLALGMIIMVAIVMTGYALLQRRAARWLR